MSKPLRDEMPIPAAWIDSMRDAFGTVEIDASMRCGLRHDCAPIQRFYASQGDCVVGSRFIPQVLVSGKDMVLRLPPPDAPEPSRKNKY